MSEGFTVTLSPYMFVISVELLAIAVRHNVKIKGITQNGVEKKHNQFIHDTVLIIAAEDESLAEVVKVTDHFKQIS